VNDNVKMPPVICAYYTDNYKNEVETLKESLDKLGITYYVKRYESRGYWEANTCIKPEFLLECLDRFPGRSIVYLDADAVVRKPLSLFDNIEADIGVFHCSDAGGFSHKYLTGTIFIANNSKSRLFIKDWIECQRGVWLGVDQDSFDKAMAINKDLSVFNLPESYVKIFDRTGADAVIEHFQASRKKVKLQRFIKKLRNACIIIFAVSLVYWFLVSKLAHLM